MVATIAAAITAAGRGSGIRDPGSGTRLAPSEVEGDPVIRLATRSLARDKRADLFDAPRVEHVMGLDPTATRGADAEPHLPREPFGTVAVAVDGDCDTRRRGTACDGAIHVEMAGRAVDFHRRSCLRRCVK